MTYSVRSVLKIVCCYQSCLLPTDAQENYFQRSIKIYVRGGTVVKVPCYKSEGRWFDPSWCHWNFSLTKPIRSHYGPGVDLASNRNEYEEYFLGVKAAGA